jgi:hypothetical protein
LDPKGFVLTGVDAGVDRKPLETSRRGVFAIGDVRSGSVKRVAAAVGEGAQVVATLHGVLAKVKPPGAVESVRGLHQGLHSFRNMRRMEASLRKARALRFEILPILG